MRSRLRGRGSKQWYDIATVHSPNAGRQRRSFERFANLNQEAAEKEENDKESLQYLQQSESGRL